jgi:cysteine desulfurase
MGVNNEMGAIQPIEAISKVLEDHPTIHFHVDINWCDIYFESKFF